MAEVEIQYLSGHKKATDFGDDLEAAITRVRELFQGTPEASMPGDTISIIHKGKECVFPTDKGISFENWDKNVGGPWGSRDEFMSEA